MGRYSGICHWDMINILWQQVQVYSGYCLMAFLNLLKASATLVDCTISQLSCFINNVICFPFIIRFSSSTLIVSAFIFFLIRVKRHQVLINISFKWHLTSCIIFLSFSSICFFDSGERFLFVPPRCCFINRQSVLDNARLESGEKFLFAPPRCYFTLMLSVWNNACLDSDERFLFVPPRCNGV